MLSGVIRSMKIGVMLNTTRANPLAVDWHGRRAAAVRTVEDCERLRAVEARPMVETADIAPNACYLATSFHVEGPDASEAMDIRMLDADIARRVTRKAELHAIDAILADLEGSAA